MKTLRIAIPSALLLLTGASEDVMKPQQTTLHIPFSQFTLENGLNVIVHSDPTLPLVSVNLWYHVGSKDEPPGRTGFAHLFEHLMFEGSAHVPAGDFDKLLESVGGVNNGSTTPDRTNYWANIPDARLLLGWPGWYVYGAAPSDRPPIPDIPQAPDALALALRLEADRMGGLLETMDQEKLDLQREVVKNERRQSYENQPYGLAWETILEALYPPGHPYRWPTIGSMEDLSSATLEDVGAFFRTYYAPNNASLAIAGFVSVQRARTLVEEYFGPIPSGPAKPEVEVPPADLAEDRYLVLEDDVRLPRLHMAWHTVPVFTQDDAVMEMAASILAEGRSSRLHRRLVYEEKVAQEVVAHQEGGEIGGAFHLVVTAKPGVELARLAEIVEEEIATLAREGVRKREMERAANGVETDFVRALERVGGFDGKADRLNEYFVFTGNPGFVRRDFDRYRRATGEDIENAVRKYLIDARKVVLGVVPRDREGEAVWERGGRGDRDR